MVNRERFLLDVDSEGFPQRYDDVPYPPAQLAALNVGRSANHAIVQALLADHKCLQCEPVDHVIPATDYTFIEQRIMAHLQCEPVYHGNPKEGWVEDARQMVREADRATDIGAKGDTLRAMGAVDGITLVSDSAAPDAYFGWKS